MNITPSLPDVQRIAAEGKYSVLPISCEILSDVLTPIEALRILQGVSTHCYMLESAQPNEKWGRYTFLGFDPKLEITCIDGEMRVGDRHFQTDDPSAVLRRILSDYRSPRLEGLPPLHRRSCGLFCL